MGNKLDNLLTLIALLSMLLSMAAASEATVDTWRNHEIMIFIPRATWLTPMTVLLLFLGVFVSLVMLSIIRLLSHIFRKRTQ